MDNFKIFNRYSRFPNFTHGKCWIYNRKRPNIGFPVSNLNNGLSSNRKITVMIRFRNETIDLYDIVYIYKKKKMPLCQIKQYIDCFLNEMFNIYIEVSS